MSTVLIPNRATASRSVVLPTDEAQLMWRPRADMRRVTRMSFWDFMLARRTPYARPDGIIRSTKTASNYERLVLQMLRHQGADIPKNIRKRAPDPAKIAKQTTISHDVALSYGPRDRSWEDIMPDWEKIHDFTQGGHPRYEAHRKALLWWAAYWGLVDRDLPAWVQGAWALEEDVHTAKAAGEINARNLRFRLPEEFSRLAGAHPYEDMLVELRGKWAKGTRRREARLLDAIWRCAIHTEFYLLRRPQDMWALEMRHVVRDEDGTIRLEGVEQWKKAKKPINPAVPETWVLNDPGNNAPSLRWYLNEISPQIPGGTNPRDKIFRKPDGETWSDNAFRDFLGDGIQYVLGRPIGPHALRRGGATWRRLHGWSAEAVARLLGDTRKVAEETYIDHDWITTMNGPYEAASERPSVPKILPRRLAPLGTVKRGKAQGRTAGTKIQPREADA